MTVIKTVSIFPNSIPGPGGHRYDYMAYIEGQELPPEGWTVRDPPLLRGWGQTVHEATNDLQKQLAAIPKGRVIEASAVLTLQDP